MRILFLSNLFPPHELGGYEQLCEEVAVSLLSRGHAVHILTSCYRTERDPTERDSTELNPTKQRQDNSAVPRQGASSNKLNITRTLFLQSNIKQYRPLHFLRHFQQEEQHNQAELAALVENFQPDVVFVWGMWNLSRRLPRLAETLLPGRVAYYLCSYWPTDEDIHLDYWAQPAQGYISRFIKAPLNWLAQFYFRGIDYPPALAFAETACVSHYVRNRLVEANALPPSAKVIYNGGDLTPFYNKIMDSGHADSPLRMIYFGRLIADKGVHTAFEALAHLQEEGYADKVRLTVLGNGRDDYIDYLQRFAIEKEITHLIDFQEGVPRDEVPTWLKKHELFIFTSMWAEPLARSVMEAMMAGLLVIGAEVGGQIEMMANGENALTFQAEDAVGLAKQIKIAVDNPSMRFRIARAGQQMVMERFTQKRMVDEMEAWLLNLTSSYQSR